MLRLISQGLILCIASLISSATAAVPDIADILSAPYSGEVTATTNGGRVAWVETNKGVRNVWSAAAPDYIAQQITRYTADDGMEIGGTGLHGGSGLLLSPDGNTIIYVRGAAPSYDGISPNPMSSAKPTAQIIYRVSVAGGAPVRIVAGNAPALVDSGKTLLFVFGGKIQAIALDDKQQIARPQLLFSMRGTLAGYVPSPDGKEIAFVSNRGQHSLIGIFSRRLNTIRWIMPDVKSDILPAWSLDGKKLAFIRFAGKLNDFKNDLTAAEAFSIGVADAVTGVGKIIFTSSARAGGFAQYYPAKPLRWASENQLIFYSETDGWIRLYRIASTGGLAIDISPAGCEVEHSSQTRDGNLLYFTSNCRDRHARHIYSIGAKDKIASQITVGGVIDTDVVATSAGAPIFYRHAEAQEPTAVMMRTADKTQRISAALPNNFPLKKLVLPQTVSFKASDGQLIYGQLFRDAVCESKKCPALIYVHGGPIRQMLPGWHNFSYYHNDYGFNQWMAMKGYVVLSVNYRAGVGYGQDFRRAANQGPRGSSEYKDVLASHKYLAGLSTVDPTRIGIWGGSYGGFLTALALARDSDKFAVGVDYHGVHNWRAVAEKDEGGGWGISGEEALSLAYKSSPIADIARWKSPVLLVHGDHDSSVSISETTDLAERLSRQGVAYETLILPDEEHDFLRWATWDKVLRATADFLDRKLKP
jgi:dipeptidyl aminopeptidase/acylaminoacyl peptidase